jgi:hypothetical protein
MYCPKVIFTTCGQKGFFVYFIKYLSHWESSSSEVVDLNESIFWIVCNSLYAEKIKFFNCDTYKAAFIFDWSYSSSMVSILYESVDESLQYLPSSHNFHFLSYSFLFFPHKFDSIPYLYHRFWLI